MPVQQKFSQMWSFLRVPAVPIHPASRGVAAHTAGFYKVQVATTTMPRNILQTTFCPNSTPQDPSKGCFFHCSPPWGLPKLGNFKFSTPWGLPKLGNFKYFPIPLFPQTLEKTAIHNVLLNISMVQYGWPAQTQIYEILPKHCFSQCVYNISHQKHGNLHVLSS